MREGLYAKLTEDGLIKRYLSTIERKIPLEDVSISDELIRFSEKTFPISVRPDIDWSFERIEQIESDPRIYMEIRRFADSCVSWMMGYDPVCATLIRLQLEDEADHSGNTYTEKLNNVLSCLDAVRTTQCLIDNKLSKLSLGQLIWKSGKFILTSIFYVNTQYTMGRHLRKQHIFRSIASYYSFLLYNLVESKPNIARCEYCGRYFVPKTRKKTRYCDRVIRNGRTCKQIAPRLNSKERAAADRVISEFDRVKDMLLHRLDRAEDRKKASPIDLTRDTFYQWLDDATAARNRYLAGELTAEEAFAIIHVPTIHELREQDSAELTVANSGTES